MVLGKFLILLTSTPAFANLENPRFFEYRAGNNVIADFIQISFGWFKTLDDNEKEAYYSSITHALMYAENGEAVEWYRGKASGFSVPVATWPTGSGYCRRIYMQVIAHNTEKVTQRTACYNNSSRDWQWRRE